MLLDEIIEVVTFIFVLSQYLIQIGFEILQKNICLIAKALRLLLSRHVNNVLLALESLLVVQQEEVIYNHHSLLLQLGLLTGVIHGVQSVAQNRDQQVHEDDDDDERSEDEECPDDAAVFSLAVISRIRVADADEVQLHQDIDDMVAGVRAHVLCFVSHVDDVVEVGEGHGNDNQHYREGFDIRYDLSYKSNEMSGVLKYSHQVIDSYP